MAEFEIAPETHSFEAGVTKITPSPVGAAIGEGGADVADKAIYLITKIKKQHQDEANLNALVAYKQGVTQVDEDAVKINDPTQRIGFVKEGYARVLGDVTKNFSVSPQANKTLQIEYANDVRGHVLKAASDAHTQARKDITSTLKGAALAISQSGNATQTKRLEAAAYQHIDQAVSNSIVSPDEAKLLKSQLGRDVNSAHYEQLLTTHPESIMTIPFDKSGLTAKEFNAYQGRALAKLNYEQNEPQRQFHDEQMKALAEATPGNAQRLYDDGKISREHAAFILGHKPTEADQVVSDHWLGELDTAGSKDELNSIYQQSLNHNATGRGALSFAYHQKLQELNSEHGQLAADMYNNVSDSLDAATPYAIPGDPSLIKNRKFNVSILHWARAMFKNAKNEKDMNDAYNNLNGQIAKHYAPAVDTTSAPAAVETPPGVKAEGAPESGESDDDTR